MRYPSAGEWLLKCGIGVGCGLVAGLNGVAQWLLTAHDYAVRLAAFHAVQRSSPGFNDATNVERGNFWFWCGTAPLAAFVVLVSCLLAAFTVCWFMYGRRTGVVIDWQAAAESRRDGVIAAWIAATVGAGIWLAATLVTTATPSVSDAAFFTTCQALLGILVFGMLIPLAPVAANMGIRVRQHFSHGRRTARNHA